MELNGADIQVLNQGRVQNERREINGQEVRVSPKTEDVIKKAERDISTLSAQEIAAIKRAAQSARRINGN